ncbi:MAG: HD family phosphohydrolase [Candidatus Kryptoniota bacterium]
MNIDRKKNILIKIFLFLALVTVISLLAPSQNQLTFNYDVGTIWTHEDLIAPFSFPIYKNDVDYQKEIKQAAANVHPVYDRVEIGNSRADSAVAIISQIQNAIKLHIKSVRDENKRTFARDSDALHSLLQALPYKFSDSDWHQMLAAVNRNPSILNRLSGLVPSMREIIASDYQPGIIDRPRGLVGSSIIVVREKNSETSVFTDQVLTPQDVFNQLDQAASTIFKGDTASEAIISSAVAAQVNPNLTYDGAETQREINAAVDLVPRTVGFVKENERIISKHDRITSDIKLKLDSLEKALRERTGKTDIILQYVGRFLLVFVITGLLSIYLFLFRKKVFFNNKMVSLIAVVLVFEALLMYFAFTAQTTLPVEYLVLVPVASMIVAIIFDSRMAFQTTVAVALLVGAMKGNDFGAAFAALSAGALAVYTVRDIRNRTQIFRSLVFIFIGYSVASLAISLQTAEDASSILADLSLIAINSVLSPIITFGFLIFFEKVFNIATDLTLLELSDFNQPLLRELSQKAPGTFHHSIIVGTLAEKAAEAVGANSILARVGAYYHDIGKTLRPGYFIENTMDSDKSKHEWLPPDVSVQMVVSHVADGIELAKKHHLPQRIINFIPMHHGTTLVAYFYGKALRRPFATGDVSQEDYRYDGPKPDSKETAIVMLADSVEAATRSLQEKSMENLEAMVDAIVKSRYEEGQLNETNLTFSDLTKIKESFLAVLSGIYHKRIEYPGQSEKIMAGPENLSELPIPYSESSNGAREVPEPVGELSQKEINEFAPPAPSRKRRKRKAAPNATTKYRRKNRQQP